MKKCLLSFQDVFPLEILSYKVDQYVFCFISIQVLSFEIAIGDRDTSSFVRTQIFILLFRSWIFLDLKYYGQ